MLYKQESGFGSDQWEWQVSGYRPSFLGQPGNEWVCLKLRVSPSNPTRTACKAQEPMGP